MGQRAATMQLNTHLIRQSVEQMASQYEVSTELRKHFQPLNVSPVS